MRAQSLHLTMPDAIYLARDLNFEQAAKIFTGNWYSSPVSVVLKVRSLENYVHMAIVNTFSEKVAQDHLADFHGIRFWVVESSTPNQCTILIETTTAARYRMKFSSTPFHPRTDWVL